MTTHTCSVDGCLNESHRQAITSKCHACYTTIRKYGITIPQRNQMLKDQGNACLICNSHIEFCGSPTGKHQAAIDHCHSSGDVRGILCGACNVGLGKFYDDPDLLRKAADYIEVTK